MDVQSFLDRPWLRLSCTGICAWDFITDQKTSFEKMKRKRVRIRAARVAEKQQKTSHKNEKNTKPKRL